MNYELIFALDPSLEPKQAEEMYLALLTQEGFKVTVGSNMGKRATAYPVNKKHEAVYVTFVGTGEPSLLKPFEKKLKLDEKVLRFMALKR